MVQTFILDKGDENIDSQDFHILAIIINCISCFLYSC